MMFGLYTNNMKRSKLKELFYGFIVNHRTKEIHSVSEVKSNCNINLMTRAEYCSKRRAKNYLLNGYNGCSKCFKSEDKG